MKNFYNNIVNGNSLEILKKIPDKTFDLVFADPPYNMQIGDKLRLVELMINGINLKVLNTMMISVRLG